LHGESGRFALRLQRLPESVWCLPGQQHRQGRCDKAIESVLYPHTFSAQPKTNILVVLSLDVMSIKNADVAGDQIPVP
jgi:hypothetical protein